jgi:ubiquinone/menaquinone biosynthesis C-methylase UbiE
MYESTANAYAAMMDNEIKLPIYRDVLGRLQENIAGLPGSLIDTACGSGHMLAMFRSQYDPDRSLIGIDLSPGMAALSEKLLGEDACVLVGDMRSLAVIGSGTAAAVINFFAIHHLDPEGIDTAMREWYRVLVQKGWLLLAAWEGSGAIDYGNKADLVALRYTGDEIRAMAERAGFRVLRCSVEPVEDFPMDAVYLECKKDEQIDQG